MTIKQSVSDEKRAKIFKALSEVKRIEILRYVYLHPSEPTCSEMTETLNLNKSNRSYHLKILQEAGLIDLTRQGQYKKITIKEDTFNEFIPGFLDTL